MHLISDVGVDFGHLASGTDIVNKNIKPAVPRNCCLDAMIALRLIGHVYLADGLGTTVRFDAR